MNGEQNVIKVFLVNGESRSVKLDERMDVAVRGRGGEGRGGEGVCGSCRAAIRCGCRSAMARGLLVGRGGLPLLSCDGVLGSSVCSDGRVCETLVGSLSGAQPMR